MSEVLPLSCEKLYYLSVSKTFEPDCFNFSQVDINETTVGLRTEINRFEN